MRTFCGLAGYRTLPNKYKKEPNNNEKPVKTIKLLYNIYLLYEADM